MALIDDCFWSDRKKWTRLEHKAHASSCQDNAYIYHRLAHPNNNSLTTSRIVDTKQEPTRIALTSS